RRHTRFSRDWSSDVCSSDLRIVTMVAEFTANKRQRDLVEALAILRCRDVHVLFAGTGPEEYPVEILAFKRGVFDRVHFLGVRDEIGRASCRERVAGAEVGGV